jgi:hypothetical protein
MAAALLLIATSTFVGAQSPTETDPHHPSQNTMPAPAPGQLGMDDMSMMNMMGSTPMMNMMRMMRMMASGMDGMATIDRIEGRIAFLRTELKITDAQASAWNAFADALRANAQKLGEVRASMMPQSGGGQQQSPTLVDRLDLQERWLVARLDGTRAIKSAFVNLYRTLSDEQKKTANELLAPHMGMEMMVMMQGRMQQPQPRQMQPGQMQPGQMRPGQMMPGQMQR